MRLYYTPGACSLAAHIVVREAGLSVELVEVDLKQKRARGADFRKVNPRGQVPTLELDDGQIMTEASAILPYLADRRPDAELAPVCGTFERYRLTEWLSFLSTEVHKSYAPFFAADAPETWRDRMRGKITERLAFVVQHLRDRPYLMGEHFTVADAYLYVLLRWAPDHRIPVDPILRRYERMIEQRPAVRAAVAEEGLRAAA